MVKKKIKINTRATREIDKYPLVSVYWLDICSDSSVGNLLMVVRKQNYLYVLQKVIY